MRMFHPMEIVAFGFCGLRLRPEAVITASFLELRTLAYANTETA